MRLYIYIYIYIYAYIVSVMFNNYINRNNEGHTSVLYLRGFLEPESTFLLGYLLRGVHNVALAVAWWIRWEGYILLLLLGGWGWTMHAAVVGEAGSCMGHAWPRLRETLGGQPQMYPITAFWHVDNNEIAVILIACESLYSSCSELQSGGVKRFTYTAIHYQEPMGPDIMWHRLFN